MRRTSSRPASTAVWKPTDTTTIHAGYARYFSPPPFELVASQDVALFDNTTAASGGGPNDTPKAERADYFDAGMRAEAVRQLDRGIGQLLQDVQEPDRRRPVWRTDHPDALQLR